MEINFISSFPHHEIQDLLTYCVLSTFNQSGPLVEKMITISISLLKNYRKTKCITTGRKINGLLFAHNGINNY